MDTWEVASSDWGDLANSYPTMPDGTAFGSGSSKGARKKQHKLQHELEQLVQGVVQLKPRKKPKLEPHAASAHALVASEAGANQPAVEGAGGASTLQEQRAKQLKKAAKLATANRSQPPATVAATPAAAVDLSAFKLAPEKAAAKQGKKQPGKRQREAASQHAADANGVEGGQLSVPAAKRPQVVKKGPKPASGGAADNSSRPAPSVSREAKRPSTKLAVTPSVQDSAGEAGAAGKAGRRQRQKRSRLRKLEKQQRQAGAASEAPTQAGNGDSAGVTGTRAAAVSGLLDAAEGRDAQPAKKQGRQKPAVPEAQAMPHVADRSTHEHAALQRQPETSSAKEGEGRAPQQDHAATQEQRPASRGKDGRAGTGLLAQMRAKLAGGRFRWLNEQLYTSRGDEAFSLMQEQPDLYEQYHEGFRQQTEGWPVQPVDRAIAWLKAKPASLVVADFGCGDAKIAASVAQKVHSLDLVAGAPGVIACNMAATTLESGSLDVAIFCLALMGTDYPAFLREAHRVLRPGGWLWIAEVRSRFAQQGTAQRAGSSADGAGAFLAALEQLGFKLKHSDMSNKMFAVFELQKRKGEQAAGMAAHIEWPELKPCMYKRR